MSNTQNFKGHIIWIGRNTIDTFGSHEHSTVHSAAIEGHISGNSLLTFDWLPSPSMEGGIAKLFAEDGHHFSGQAAELESTDTQEDLVGNLHLSKHGTSVITGNWLRKGESCYWIAEFDFI